MVHRKALITIIIIRRYILRKAPYYEQCLASCGYNEKLPYQQQGENIENIKNIRKNQKPKLYGLTHPTANC